MEIPSRMPASPMGETGTGPSPEMPGGDRVRPSEPGSAVPPSPAIERPVGLPEFVTPGEIEKAFDGEIKRPRVTVPYRVSMGVVGVSLVVLTALYAAMVAGVALGTLVWADKGWQFTSSLPIHPHAQLLLFFLWITPVLAGALLVLFLIKPFLARRGSHLHEQRLHRAREPVVYAFVESLCRRIGVPVPKNILVNCDVDAQVLVRGGLLGFFRHHIELHIGLPLVTGLTARELAGVIAHELGHFAQGGGMYFGGLIRFLNLWLERVVFERDIWDVRLFHLAKDRESRFAFVFEFARGCVWVTRRILWLFWSVGHGISAFLGRQLEFDADQYAVALVGSDTASSTLLRIRTIDLAHRAVAEDLQELWKEGRLADDLPTLVSERVAGLSPETVEKIDEATRAAKTRWYADHPSDAARIRKSEKRNVAGVFRLDAPALALFRNYPEAARLASIYFYTEALGERFNPDQLVSTPAFLSRRRREREEARARDAYFGEVFSPVYPLTIPETPLVPPDDPESTARELREAYERITAAASDALQASRGFREAYDRWIRARWAQVVHEAGIRFDARAFALDGATREAADQAAREAEGDMGRYQEILDPYAGLARTRLLCALQLLLLPEVQERLGAEVDSPEEIRRIHGTLARLSWGHGFIQDLRRDFMTYAIFLTNPERYEGVEGFSSRLRRSVSVCYQHLKHIYASFQSERYPFEHSDGPISVARFMMGASPAHEHGAEVVPKCRATLENFNGLYARVLGRLARQTRRMENLLGYQEIPMPTLEDEAP